MSSPIEGFIEWYKSLPVSHRQDIAGFVGAYCPGFGKGDFSMAIEVHPDLFIEAVRHYQDGGFGEIGATLSLRSFIQLIFIDKRSDRNGWKETKGLLESIAREEESEKFERIAREVTFNAEQWITSCDKWNKLIANDLSDQNIKTLLS
jgi:hypothetical protein